MRGACFNYIEYAFDYAHAEPATGKALRLRPPALVKIATHTHGILLPGLPLASKTTSRRTPRAYFNKGASANSDLALPNRIEDVAVNAAATANPADAKAPYYLGNYWYAGRQYAEAIACLGTVRKNRQQLRHRTQEPGPGLPQQTG